MSVPNETILTPSGEKESSKMLTLNYAGDTAAEAPSQHLGLEDFERAGVRVAERRFGEKDTIFAPGDPDGQLYFLL